MSKKIIVNPYNNGGIFFEDDDQTLLHYGGIKKITQNSTHEEIPTAKAVYDFHNENEFDIVGIEPIKVEKQQIDDSIISISTSINTKLNGITYGNNKYIVVGNKGTILTSNDEISWSFIPINYNYDILDIIFAKELFVAVGNKEILTSSNGLTWNINTFTNEMKNIIYGNDIFIVYGINNTIYTSVDGLNWIDQNISIINIRTIDYFNNMFIISDSNGRYIYGSTGLTWSIIYTLETSSPSYFNYSNNHYIVGNGKKVSISTDLITWEVKHITNQVSDIIGIDYFYNEEICSINLGDYQEFVALFGSLVIGSSTKPYNKMTIYNNNVYMYGENDFFTTYINNIPMWKKISDKKITKIYNNVFIGDGILGYIRENSTKMFNFNFLDGTMKLKNPIKIISDNINFIAICEENYISTSNNGYDWTNQQVMLSNEFKNIYYLNGIYIISCDHEDFLISTDFTNWTLKTLSSTISTFDISYLNGIYVIISNNKSFTSNDNCVTWQETTLSNFPMTNIISDNSQFIAYESNILQTSVDGINWIQRTSPNISEIYYLNSKYFIVDNTNIYKSNDLNIWILLDVTLTSIPQLYFLNNLFIITSSTDKLLYSSDLDIWFEGSYGTNIVYLDKYYIIDGEDVKSSVDLINWSIVPYFTFIPNAKLLSNNSTIISYSLNSIYTTYLDDVNMPIANSVITNFVLNNVNDNLVYGEVILKKNNNLWNIISNKYNFLKILHINNIYYGLTKNYIYTSSDLINWVIYFSRQKLNLLDMLYGNNMLIILSEGNEIYYNSNIYATDGNIIKGIFENDRFVIIFDNGEILLTNDFINTTLTPINSFIPSDLIYINGKIFVIGNNGKLFISDDEAITWNQINIGTTSDLIAIDEFGTIISSSEIYTTNDYLTWSLKNNSIGLTSIDSELITSNNGVILYKFISYPTQKTGILNKTNNLISIGDYINTIDISTSSNIYTISIDLPITQSYDVKGTNTDLPTVAAVNLMNDEQEKEIFEVNTNPILYHQSYTGLIDHIISNEIINNYIFIPLNNTTISYSNIDTFIEDKVFTNTLTFTNITMNQSFIHFINNEYVLVTKNYIYHSNTIENLPTTYISYTTNDIKNTISYENKIYGTYTDGTFFVISWNGSTYIWESYAINQGYILYSDKKYLFAISLLEHKIKINSKEYNFTLDNEFTKINWIIHEKNYGFLAIASNISNSIFAMIRSYDGINWEIIQNNIQNDYCCYSTLGKCIIQNNTFDTIQSSNPLFYNTYKDYFISIYKEDVNIVKLNSEIIFTRKLSGIDTVWTKKNSNLLTYQFNNTANGYFNFVDRNKYIGSGYFSNGIGTYIYEYDGNQLIQKPPFYNIIMSYTNISSCISLLKDVYGFIVLNSSNLTSMAIIHDTRNGTIKTFNTSTNCLRNISIEDDYIYYTYYNNSTTESYIDRSNWVSGPSILPENGVRIDHYFYGFFGSIHMAYFDLKGHYIYGTNINDYNESLCLSYNGSNITQIYSTNLFFNNDQMVYKTNFCYNTNEIVTMDTNLKKYYVQSLGSDNYTTYDITVDIINPTSSATAYISFSFDGNNYSYAYGNIFNGNVIPFIEEPSVSSQRIKSMAYNSDDGYYYLYASYPISLFRVKYDPSGIIFDVYPEYEFVTPIIGGGVTTIDENSTHDNMPTAKAVYDFTNQLNKYSLDNIGEKIDGVTYNEYGEVIEVDDISEIYIKSHITINNSLIEINRSISNVFVNKPNIKKVVFPDTFSNLANNNFIDMSCTVYLNNNINTLGENIFNNGNYKYTIIPESITQIPNDSFNNISSTYSYIPDTAIEILNNVMQNSNIQVLSIPNKALTIGSGYGNGSNIQYLIIRDYMGDDTYNGIIGLNVDTVINLSSVKNENIPYTNVISSIPQIAISYIPEEHLYYLKTLMQTAGNIPDILTQYKESLDNKVDDEGFLDGVTYDINSGNARVIIVDNIPTIKIKSHIIWTDSLEYTVTTILNDVIKNKSVVANIYIPSTVSFIGNYFASGIAQNAITNIFSSDIGEYYMSFSNMKYAIVPENVTILPNNSLSSGNYNYLYLPKLTSIFNTGCFNGSTVNILNMGHIILSNYGSKITCNILILRDTNGVDEYKTSIDTLIQDVTSTVINLTEIPNSYFTGKWTATTIINDLTSDIIKQIPNEHYLNLQAIYINLFGGSSAIDAYSKEEMDIKLSNKYELTSNYETLPIKINGVTYSLIDEYICVTGIDSNINEIFIKDYLNTTPVSRYDISTYPQSGLSKLVLPDTMTTISSINFLRDNPVPLYLKLPRYLSSVGNYFMYQSKIKEAIFPNSLTTFPIYSLYNGSFGYIRIQDTLTSVGTSFLSLSSITCLNLPNINISFPNAFSCSLLILRDKTVDVKTILITGATITPTSIINLSSVPNSVVALKWPGKPITNTIIGNTYFNNISYEEYQYLLSLEDRKPYIYSVENISNTSKFMGVTYNGNEVIAVDNIAEIIVKDTFNGITITKINDNVFYQKSNIKKIILPNTITTIGQSFMREVNAEVILPNSVVSLGSYSFYDSICKYCIFPDNFTNIGQYTGKGTFGYLYLPDNLNIFNVYTFNEGTFDVVSIPNKSFSTIPITAFIYQCRYLIIRNFDDTSTYNINFATNINVTDTVINLTSIPNITLQTLWPSITVTNEIPSIALSFIPFNHVTRLKNKTYTRLTETRNVNLSSLTMTNNVTSIMGTVSDVSSTALVTGNLVNELSNSEIIGPTINGITYAVYSGRTAHVTAITNQSIVDILPKIVIGNITYRTGKITGNILYSSGTSIKKLIIPDTITSIVGSIGYDSTFDEIILNNKTLITITSTFIYNSTLNRLIVDNININYHFVYGSNIKYLYIGDDVTHTGSNNCIGSSVINILNIPNKNFSSATVNTSTNTIQYMIIRPSSETTFVFPKRTTVINVINLTGISGIESYIPATNYLTDIPDEIKSLIPQEHLLELNTPTELYTNNFKLGNNTVNKIFTNTDTTTSDDSALVTDGYLQSQLVSSTADYVKTTDARQIRLTNNTSGQGTAISRLHIQSTAPTTSDPYATGYATSTTTASSNANLIPTAAHLNELYGLRTESRAVSLTNTSNNIQVGTLKLGTNTTNTLNKILLDNSLNSTLNTDVVTAGYLNAKTYVQRTDSNILSFSNTSNNIQAGTLKLGTNTTNTLNKILLDNSLNSTLNTDVVSAGYLSKELVNKATNYYGEPTEWKESTLPSAVKWHDVVYGNNKFVAVAYNSNIAAYSTDGITWIETTLPSVATWRRITYGNNKFVAIAYISNKSVYSEDGINWIETQLPSSAPWHDITYGNNKFVIIANNSNKAAHSLDGITWTETTLPSSVKWYGVTYGNNKFVTIADDTNKAAYSSDGINWIETTLPSNAKWRNITYGNNKFVAVATVSNKSVYSLDGINWTDSTLPSSADWYNLTYGNNKFVAFANKSDKSAYSYDGITWTPTELPLIGDWLGITYGNNKFVIVSNLDKLIYSVGMSELLDYDEAKYVTKDNPILNNEITINNKVVNSVLQSSDSSVIPDKELITNGYLQSQLVASGLDYVKTTDARQIRLTNNTSGQGTAISRLHIQSTAPTTSDPYATGYATSTTTASSNANLIPTAAHLNELYGLRTESRAVSLTNTSNNIQVGTLKLGTNTTNTLNKILLDNSLNSTLNTDVVTAGYLNAKTYVQRTDSNILSFSNTSNNIQAGTLKLGTNTTNTLNKILLDNSLNSTLNTDVVSAGYLSKELVNKATNYYGEPTEWKESTLPSAVKWHDVVYGNNKFVAVAYNSNIAAYSTDGITWIETTLPSVATWRRITYGNNKFVAIAYISNKSVYSEDGINWIETQLPSSAPWHDITYGNNKFVIIANNSNKAAHSLDGITWTETTLPSSVKWYGVTYGNNKFVTIADDTNKAAYSSDGINWIETTLPSNAKWRNITYGNNKFVAVATVSNKSVYSLDGINWTDSTLPSSADWYNLTYGNNKFVAFANKSDKSAYSYDGITWTPTELPLIGDWLGITYGNNKFVIVSNLDKLIYSVGMSELLDYDEAKYVTKDNPILNNEITINNKVVNSVLQSSDSSVIPDKELITNGYLQSQLVASGLDYVKTTDARQIRLTNNTSGQGTSIGRLYLQSTAPTTSNPYATGYATSTTTASSNANLIPTASHVYNLYALQTDSRTVSLTNTSNTIQAGTLKLGKNVSNYLNSIVINTSLLSYSTIPLSSANQVVTPSYLRNGYSIRHTMLPCMLSCQYYYRNKDNYNNLSYPHGMYPNGVIMKTIVDGEFIFMSHNDVNLTNYPYTNNIIHITPYRLTYKVPETNKTYITNILYDSNTIKKYCGEIKITRPISTRNDCLRASLSYWNYDTMFTILYDTISNNVNNPVIFSNSSNAWSNIYINLSYMRIDDGGSSNLRDYFANI
jgi:hypothetical protein